MGSKAERSREKLLYLADATENRAHELEEYLEERARWDEENKKQATKANEAAKGLAAADENRMNGAKPLYKSPMIRNERS